MALELAQGDEARFAVVEAGIFECHARPGEHGFCVIKAEAVLGQVLVVLGVIPFVHGCDPLIVTTNVTTIPAPWQKEDRPAVMADQERRLRDVALGDALAML